MLSLVARCDDHVRRFALPQSEASLGSAGDNEIVLPFVGVSHRHAKVVPATGGVRITDLASKNGIVVDQERVAECELVPGRSVRLGKAVLSVEESDTSDLTTGLVVSACEISEPPKTTSMVARPSEADALRLIASLERQGGDIRECAQSWIAAACGILRASALQWVEVRRGEVSLLAAAGCDVPRDVIEQALREKHDDEVIRRFGETSVLFRIARPRVVLPAFSGPPRRVAAWERDFFAFLAGRLLDVSRAAAPVRERQREPKAAAPTMPIVAESAGMRAAMDAVTAYAGAARPLLLLGETGTGKELLARRYHEMGPAAAGPFLAINCAEVPKNLLESELFGVERGVATGVEARAGLFAAAEGGTLFLDEIGELAEETQAALLRVLELGEVRPVGGRAARRIHVRAVLATRRGIGQHGIREDLFYRCYSVTIPPLRERRDDVVPLALHFLERVCRERRLPRVAISRKALALLLDHTWPGNVRELEHTIEQAVIRYGSGGALHSEHFSTLRAAQPLPLPQAETLTLRDECEELERQRIDGVLRQTGGNKAAAARLLGMSRNGLRKKLARLFEM